MSRLAESLEQFPGNRGLIVLPSAIKLFPMVTDDLIDRDVSVIQISQNHGLRLPNADDVMKYVGGAPYLQLEMSDKTSDFDPKMTNETHEKYSWAITKACSDEPMCELEIVRFTQLLDLKESSQVSGITKFLLESQQIEHVENIVYLRKSTREPSIHQSIYVETNSKGYKTKKRGRKVKPDRPIPTLPLNPSPRELVRV